MYSRLLNSIYYSLDAIALWSLVWNFNRLFKKKGSAIVFVLGEIAVFLFSFFLPDLAQFSFILVLAVPMLIVRENIENKVVDLLLSFFSVGVLNDIILIILQFIFGRGYMLSDYKAVSITLTLIILLIVYRTRLFKKLVQSPIRIKITTKILCLFTMISTMLMTSFGEIMLRTEERKGVVLIFLVFSLTTMTLAVAIIVKLFRETCNLFLLQSENDIKSSVIYSQKTINELLEKKNDESKMFRHDINNHLGVLSLLLQNDDITEAKSYLQKMTSFNTNLGFQTEYFGDVILDVVISMMCLRASERGIEISVFGEMWQDRFNSFEISSICMNAIDNAIEACQRQDIKGPIIMRAVKTDSLQLISFSNPASYEMYSNILNFATSKADTEQHGFGIKNIRKAAANLGGDIKYEYVNGEVVLLISIELNS